MTRAVTFTQAQVRRAVKAAESGQTFIYFIQTGRFIKIGKSRHWKKRVANMQVGSPFKIEPLLILVASPELEQELHSRFHANHFRGEWYRIGPAITKFIRKNRKDCASKSSVSELPKIKIAPKNGPAGWEDFMNDPS